MKRLILASALIVAVSTASFAKKVVAEGETHTKLGNYRIELATNPVSMNGEECKTFIINYENSPMEVKVVVCKDRKCKRFVVLSDKLSVQYVCNESYFGVEKLRGSLQKEGYSTDDAALNRNEYFHQKVLSRGKGEELENTKLIAAYFPMLLKDIADVIAAK